MSVASRGFFLLDETLKVQWSGTSIGLLVTTYNWKKTVKMRLSKRN